MAFTEFYVQSTGSNLNAGSTNADAAAFTYAGGTFVRSSGVFTVASGDPASDGVAVGDFASVYTTAGASVATFVGRVTARDATTITVSTAAIAGATSSVSESAAAATCKVGGAWAGPSGSVAFPFNFAAATLTNSSGDTPRVNIKGDATETNTEYSISTGMTHTLAGSVRFQGYTSSIGDGGKARIDASTNAIVYLACSGARTDLLDMIFSGSASSGSNAGVTVSGSNCYLQGLTIYGARSHGLSCTGAGAVVVECEAYGNDTANAANTAGFYTSVACTYVRCISHNNGSAGSNAFGFRADASCHATYHKCIADSNDSDGFRMTQSGNSFIVMVGCDSYGNGGDGLELVNSASCSVLIDSCNFTKNGGYGVTYSGSGGIHGLLVNCGFGAGSEANTSGATNSSAISPLDVVGTVNYDSNDSPYVDAANGDFRITLADAKGAGRGAFTQKQSSYSGTVGYPDIGAAQHDDAGGAGGMIVHPGMSGGIRG
jgi:hypothetical protein